MNFADMAHNPLSEEIVDILKKKTGNMNDTLFFRIMAGYYLCQNASMMRTFVQKYDRQVIPVNMYALNLLPSGQGKGHSNNILERHIMGSFQDTFLSDVFPTVSQANIRRIATRRATEQNIGEEEALELVQKEFDSLGEYIYSFSEGTAAALKQLRLNLLMASVGSMNFVVDEIGSNLIKNQEMLDVYLEVYDVGIIKQKLVKNTAENTRLKDMSGMTPANLVMYGTPTKLLDGGKVEDLLNTFLDTGYGRRCFYGYVDPNSAKYGIKLTPEEILANIENSDTGDKVEQLAEHFESLARIEYVNKTLPMPRDVALCLIEYEQCCKRRAEDIPPHDSISKAEMIHRYFKVLKLAGAYAWSEKRDDISLANMQSAIKLAEESGEAFKRILARDKPHIRLAKYITTCGRELTQSDLVEDLQFYKGTNAAKNEMLTLAIAWAYKNNSVIKRKMHEGIEFISGEALEETNLDRLILSHSADAAYNYKPEHAPFDQLHKLTQIPNYNWATHHFKGSHRDDAKAITGFNMIVLDIDYGCTVETAQLLLKDYKYHMYTTKRHTDEAHRFRIVLPISHTLKLGEVDFKEFMRNVFEWLPFDSDDVTGQRARKWASHNGQYWYNEGQLVDALQFIPATSKCEQTKKQITNLSNLDNLERWFGLRMVEGQRSNEMIKYALMLVDTGMPFEDIEEAVKVLNDKLKDSLTDDELGSTILKTAYSRFQIRQRESSED